MIPQDTNGCGGPPPGCAPTTRCPPVMWRVTDLRWDGREGRWDGIDGAPLAASPEAAAELWAQQWTMPRPATVRVLSDQGETLVLDVEVTHRATRRRPS